MRHTFETEQWLPFPPELVFAFFANPENLPRLMPSWQKARIEEAAFRPPPPRPPSALAQRGIAAGAGTRLTLSFRPFPLSPIRLPWDAEITDFVWNDHFCDIQHRGPFKYWKHCHRIRPESRAAQPGAQPQPGALLTDHVEYELPLGPLGDLGNLLLARRQLASTFRYRHHRTAELLPPDGGLPVTGVPTAEPGAPPRPSPHKAAPSPSPPPPSTHTSPAAPPPCRAR